MLDIGDGVRQQPGAVAENGGGSALAWAGGEMGMGVEAALTETPLASIPGTVEAPAARSCGGWTPS